MTVAVFLAGAAEGDALQDGDVVLDDDGLADDDAGGVVDEDAPPHRHGRMDVDLELGRGPALEIVGEVAPPLVPEPVGQPVRLDGLEALEIEHRIDEPVTGRVALVDRDDVDAQHVGKVRAGGEGLVEGVPEMGRADGGVAQPVGDALADDVFQARLVEDGGVNEAGERRLVVGDPPGILADPFPDRIVTGQRSDVAALGALTLGNGRHGRVSFPGGSRSEL